jgi:hypothetical protein
MSAMEQRYSTQPRRQVAAHSSTLSRLSDPLVGYDALAALNPAARRRRAQQAARDVITSAAAAEPRSSAQSRPLLNSTVTDRPVQGGGQPRKHTSIPRVKRFGSAIDTQSSNKQTQQQQRSSRSQLRSRGQTSSSTSDMHRSSAEHLRTARSASALLQPSARRRVRQRSQLAADRSKQGHSALSSSVAAWVARDDRGASRREAVLSKRAAAAGLRARTDGGSFVHAANSSSTFLTELETAAAVADNDGSSVLNDSAVVQAAAEPQSAAAAQLTALLTKQHRQRGSSAYKQQQYRSGLTLQQLKRRDKQRPPHLSVTAAPYSSSNAVEHTRAYSSKAAAAAVPPVQTSAVVDALCNKLCSQPSTATAHTSSSTTYSSESLWEGAKRAALQSRGGNDITAFRGLVPADATSSIESETQQLLLSEHPLLPVLSWRQQQQQQQQQRRIHSRSGDAPLPPSSAPSPGPLRHPVMLRSRTSPALGTNSMRNSNSSSSSSSVVRQQVAAAQRGRLTTAVTAAAAAPLVYVGKPAKFAGRLQQSQLAPSCGSSVRQGPVLRPQGFMTRSMAYSSSATWGS